MSQSADNLLWIDLEMTGLDPLRDAILEIATIVTDGQLHVLAEGPVLAIRQTPEVLSRMDEWNQEQHGKSGLLVRVRASACSEAQAEAETLRFIRAYVPASTSPMCGNSVCQDRRFLHRRMPALEGYFHYRNLDVSTVKELARRWAPALKPFEKDGRHRALDDIRASIAELRHYREHLFRV